MAYWYHVARKALVQAGLTCSWIMYDTQHDRNKNIDSTSCNDFQQMCEKGVLKRQNNAYINLKKKCSTMHHQFYQKHKIKSSEQIDRHNSYDAYYKKESRK